jgi:hypothetical protein
MAISPPSSGKMRVYSSQSIAMDSAWRSLRLRCCCSGVAALPHHRIEHVEAEEPAREVDHLRELHALVGVLAADLVGVFHVDRELHAVVGALDHRHVEVALAELALQRHLLLLDQEDDAVDEGHGLAAVGQVAGGAVFGRALAGIGHAAVVRVARQHVAAILDRLDHHVGAGADGPGVERQPVGRHARLRIEGIGFPGHGRGEGHREPELPLGSLALHADAQQMLLGCRRGRQGPAAQVEKGLVQAGRIEPLAQLRVFGFHERDVVLQADQVFGKHTRHGRGDARRRVALERVDEVLGHQLARALVLELQRRAPLADLPRLHRVVAVPALAVDSKGRMRLVADARRDADVVDALGDLLGRRIAGQQLTGLVDVARHDDLLRGLRNERVGTLQVVIAVEWLVDREGERRLVVPVGRGGVQVAGRAVQEGRVERVVRRTLAAVRVVVAASQHPQAGEPHQQGTQQPHLTSRSAPCGRPPRA